MCVYCVCFCYSQDDLETYVGQWNSTWLAQYTSNLDDMDM